MRHMIPQPGVLYSLATQEPVNTEERAKESELRAAMRRRQAERESEPKPKNDYEGVREALDDVLTENYQGDLALMARDLNMKPQELEDLLTVEGLRLTWHEIRHLERLLYLDQGKLVQNASAGKLERLQTSLVQEVLLESLKFYLASEDKAWEAQEISYKAGDEDQVFELKKQHLVELGTRTLKLSTMNLIASALYYVFKEANEQAIFKEYQDRVQQVMDSFYGEQEGEKRLNRLQGQMLWDRALQGIQEQSQRLTPKKRKEFISRWYRYEHPGITEIPKILYITTNSNGAKSGRIDKGLIIRNQDEFDRWNGTNDKNYPKIQIKWDEQLGWLVERDSLVNGVTVQYILKSLIDAGFVQESYEQELRRLTSVSLDDLNNPRIKELLLHIAQKKGGSIFYLVGLQAATSTLGDHDKISGGLAFFTEQEYTEWLPKRAYHHPQARIKHIDGAFTINKQSDLKGPNTQEIFVKMVDYNLLAEASEFKLARLTRGQPLSILSDPKVGELIHDVATSKNEHEYYIVGGSGGISDGNIVRGLEILTNEEFDQWPHKDKKYYPKIRIQACLGGWFVGHHADVCGTHAYDLLLALFENQVLMKGLEWLFTDVTAVSISDFENPEIKRLFEEIVKAKGEKKYYIVTPRQGPLQQGILQGGLRILTEEEYQKWEGKGRKHFFAFGIEFDEDLGWMGPANHKLDRPVEKGLKILELILKANLITQDPEQELRTMLINTPVTTLQNPRVNELIYFIMERKQIQTGYIIAGKGGVLANKIVGKVRVLSEAEFNDWEEKENELFPRIKIKKQGDDLVVVEMDGKKASGKGGPQILKALVVTGTLVG
ncbi:hypothetical protein KJ708_11045 [bacterium]|nr:hypothetical protein [bacterium]